MEKTEIYDFKMNVSKGIKDIIPDINLISNLLDEKGIHKKSFGVCTEPYDKYFEVYNVNESGVSSDVNPLNTINVIVNEATSSRKKRIYFYSIKINYIDGFYYICCLAQSKYYKNSTGAENTVYKCLVSEIPSILDEIFNDVEF